MLEFGGIHLTRMNLRQATPERRLGFPRTTLEGALEDTGD